MPDDEPDIGGADDEGPERDVDARDEDGAARIVHDADSPGAALVEGRDPVEPNEPA